MAFLDAAEKDKFSDTMIAIGKLPKISNLSLLVQILRKDFEGSPRISHKSHHTCCRHL